MFELVVTVDLLTQKQGDGDDAVASQVGQCIRLECGAPAECVPLKRLLGKALSEMAADRVD